MIAGATLAALAIPEVMGYTRISGTPIITGLYTILLPIIVFAIFGSSRHLVVGADSATAAILATALVALGFTQNSAEYVQMTSLAALLCAGLLILARWLRLGFIANHLAVIGAGTRRAAVAPKPTAPPRRSPARPSRRRPPEAPAIRANPRPRRRHHRVAG